MNRNPNHLLFIAEELSSCLPPCLQKYLMFLKESQHKYLRMQNKFYIYQFAKLKSILLIILMILAIVFTLFSIKNNYSFSSKVLK